MCIRTSKVFFCFLLWLLVFGRNAEAQTKQYDINSPGSLYRYAGAMAGGGFSVALQLGPIAANTTEHVMSIGSTSNLVTSLFRDSSGRWYLGKQRDGSTTPYVIQAWDPVSPCPAGAGCQRDTMYVLFHTNGQIELHEIALLATGRFSWQTGLLNYGIPLSDYQAGSPEVLVDDSTALPDFVQNGRYASYIGSLNYPNWAVTGAPISQTYNGASIQRIAGWYPGVLSTGDILGDQNSINTITLPLDALPCNTGQYQTKEVPGDSGPLHDPTKTNQYWPGFATTPCNLPGQARNYSFSSSNGTAVVSWDAPFDPGPPARPGIGNFIVSYEVTFQNGSTVKGPFVTSNTSYTTQPGDNVTAGNWLVRVSPVNNAGYHGPAAPQPVTVFSGGPQDGLPATTSCGGEGQSCTAPTGTWVAYGSFGSFALAQVGSSGSISCSNDGFGIDPNPATYKNCYSYGALPAGPMTYAVPTTGGTKGVQLVSYGTHMTRPLNGPFTCSNTTFGWATNDGSACYILSPAVLSGGQVPPQPAGFTFCTSSGGSCPAAGGQVLGYGNQYPATSNRGWDTAGYQSSSYVLCPNNAVPTRGTVIGGEVESCGYIGNGSVIGAPNGYGSCAAEYGVCYQGWSVDKPQATIAFGNQGLWTVEYFSTLNMNCSSGYCQIYCGNRSFQTDPISGTDKVCLQYGKSLVTGPMVHLPHYGAKGLDFEPSGAGTAHGLSQSVVVTNSGSATLNISSASIVADSPSKAFSVSGCTSPVAVGATCTLTVTYLNPAAGGAAASLQIVSDSPASPSTLPIYANGTGAILRLSTTSLDLSGGQAGTIGLTNTGTSMLTFSSQVGGNNATDFTVTDNCAGGIAPGASCMMSVYFEDVDRADPRQGADATVTILSNTSSSPTSVRLTGQP